MNNKDLFKKNLRLKALDIFIKRITSNSKNEPNGFNP